MTDRFNALSAWSHERPRIGRAHWRARHAMFKDDALVLDKWFALWPAAPITAAATCCPP